MTNTVLETESAPSERQVVALRLGSETYGLDIDAIHTVIMPQPITAVPNAPKFVKGVINLRGRILPVIDLRARFGLPPQAGEASRQSRIVIVEADGLCAGLVVDAVSEVLRLPAPSIDAPPQLIASAATDCLTGIGRLPNTGATGGGGGLIILLDVMRILTSETAPLPLAA